MNRKLKLTLLASTVALALSGCSSDDSETPPVVEQPNATPVLNVVSGQSIELEENSSTTIGYNIADANHSESDLVVSYEVIGLTDSDISVSLNESGKNLLVDAGNVQEDTVFSIELKVEDPEGANQTQTVSVNVLNTQNETPTASFSGYSIEDGVVEVDVEGSSNANQEFHTVEIPYNLTDSDGDELDVSVSNISGGLINAGIDIDNNDDNSGLISLTFGKVYEAGNENERTGSFVFTASDRNETTNIQFDISVGVTQVSPELTITKNIVAGGVVPFEVDEDQNITIRYEATDLNGTQVFVSGELSNPDAVENFNPNITGGTINLDGFNVTEDTILTLTLTATDNTGTPVVTDSVEINVKDTVNQTLISLNTQIDEEKVKFNSMVSRDPELTLFNFYTDYLSLTNQLTENEKQSYLTQLESGRETEINIAEVLIAEIDEERAKQEEEIDLELLGSKLEELKTANNSIGLSGILVLNQLAEIGGSDLLVIQDVQKVYKASDNSYSRYVNNPKLGFYSNEFTWEFLNANDLLENINFQTGECN